MITVNHQNYRAGKLPALAQFHVIRRLAPVMASLGMSLSSLKAMKTPDDFAELLGPISTVVAAMSDEDADYVIFTCLSVVTREQGDGRYAPVTSKSSLMFSDIDMVVMLRLVVETLRENFEGFLTGLGGASGSPSSSATGPLAT